MSSLGHRKIGMRAQPPTGMSARRAPAAAGYSLALVAAALVVGHPLLLTVILAASLIAVAACGRLRAARPYLWAAFYAGAALLVINPLFATGGLHPLVSFALGPLRIRITLEGIAFGAGQALHLAAVITAFAAATLVVDQDYQLAALGRLSARSALVVSLATRLLPVLSRDAARIADAQRSRGAELDGGRWRERASARGPLLAGLLTQSLERAVDIAASMESRGYGRSRRTVWRRSQRWHGRDLILLGSAVLAVALLALGAGLGALSYAYFPTLADPLSTACPPVAIALCGMLLAPSLWSLTWRP